MVTMEMNKTNLTISALVTLCLFVIQVDSFILFTSFYSLFYDYFRYFLVSWG